MVMFGFDIRHLALIKINICIGYIGLIINGSCLFTVGEGEESSKEGFCFWGC